MMDELEAPLPLARLQIDANEALRKKVIAGTMPAVIVARRRLDRQVSEPEIFIDRDLRPHACVAVLIPGIIQPSVIAELARHRNRVENPEALARSNIVPTNVAFVVAVNSRG